MSGVRHSVYAMTGVRVRPSRRVLFAILIGVWSAAALSALPADDAPSSASSRLAVPEESARASAEKTIRQLFREDYARHTTADHAALASKLLNAANDSSNDASALYVLLDQARLEGIAACEAEPALSAVDALAGHFQIAQSKLQFDTLTALSKQKLSPAGAAAVTNAGLIAINHAAESEDFDTVSRLAPVVESAAGKTHWAMLSARVESRLKELKDARLDNERYHGMNEALKKHPDDPSLNMEVGRFIAINRGDWPRALPYLVNGGDKDLKVLAEADLAVTSEGASAAALDRGEAWWRYSARQSGATRAAAERRAAFWYQQGLDSASGLHKVQLEERIRQAQSDSDSVAAKAGAAARPDSLSAKAKRDAINKSPVVPFPTKTIDASISVPPGLGPYLVHGDVHVTGQTGVTLAAGTEIRGGGFVMVGGGHVVATGTDTMPVIFRHVTFNQDLGSSVVASNVIFDQCTFTKGGAWFSSYSSKWQFTACVLYGCRFSRLTEVDYGFQIQNCAIVSMDIPEIQHPHNPGFDHAAVLRSDWNKIVGCDFVDCTVPPTVFWCAQDSNFRACRFTPGEAFESAQAWEDHAFVSDTIGPSPQSAWAVNPPKHANIQLIVAPQPFPALSLTDIDAVIPELVFSPDRGPSVLWRHLK